jgi:hypothetical protein
MHVASFDNVAHAIKTYFPDQRIIYVPGNHEYYHNTGHNLLGGHHDLGDNVDFLENSAIILDDVMFYGGTMWTDFDNNSPIARNSCEQYTNDYRQSNLTPGITYNLHQEFKKNLKNLSIPNYVRKLVIVSHHLPTQKSSSSYPINRITPCFVANVDECFDISPKLALWVHGHSHESSDYLYGPLNTRVVCNPLGYFPNFNCDFSINKIVEV